jgi:putative FmdB family regulatory protein
VPFYEYRCVKGHTFEVTQRMSDEPLTKCEVCGKKASRVLFAPAIHFKGTGFHNTDYGSKRRGTGSDDGGSASTAGDTSTTSNGGSGDAAGGSGGTTTSSDTSSSSGGGKTVGLDKV